LRAIRPRPALGPHFANYLFLFFGADPFTSLAQCQQETRPVLIVPEDILAPVPTIHDVIHGTQLLNTQLARHGPILSETGNHVNGNYQ
jgi:hypothetical protein